MTDVSVIIPAHNREKLIERALRSVLSQTYPDLEALVVDDDSKDGTARKVRDLCSEDSRVRLLRHSTNLGAQAARNTGAKAAKGRWIAFLDSDDRWLPDSLEKRLRLAEDKNAKVVHSDCWVVRRKDEAPQRFGVPPFRGQSYADLLRRPGPLFQGLLVTKDALEQIGLLDETIVAYQEWDTAIRLAREHEFEFLQEPTFVYHCDHEGTISKNLARNARGYEQVFTKHRHAILRRLGPKALSTHYLNAWSYYREAGGTETAAARRCLVSGLLLWPFRPKGILRALREKAVRNSAENQ